jgi:hypothetical protein
MEQKQVLEKASLPHLWKTGPGGEDPCIVRQLSNKI